MTLILGASTACQKQEPAPAAPEPAPAPKAEPTPAPTPEPVADFDWSTLKPGDVESGKAVYGKICFACHAADGRGNGGITGGDFVGQPERLAKSDVELLNTIRGGKTSGSLVMPAQKGVLTEQEMADALAYIRATFGKQGD